MKSYIVAEIASNWEGKISTAKKLIKESKKAGADAVKFQMWRATDLYKKVEQYRPSRALNTLRFSYVWNGWSDGETRLPKEITSLEKLKDLYISINMFKEFPNDVCYIQNLEFLYVNYNELSSIPDDLRNMPKLKGLYLKGNNITKLNPAVCKITTLRDIDLENNQLKELPHEMKDMPKLRKLNLRDNLFTQTDIGRLLISLPNTKIKYTIPEKF